MKQFVVLVYVLSHSFVSGQLCSDLPSLATIENDFRSAVNASIEQTVNNFTLGEIFFNCIRYGSPEGSTFRETRITARYQVAEGSFIGQVLYGCVEINGNIVWVSDDTVGVVLKSGVESNGTERCSDCRETSPTTCTVCPSDCDQGELNSDCSGCVCNDGYTGSACDADINECQTTPSVCEGGGICANFIGSFNCTCPNSCTGECNACCSSPCTRGGTCSSNSPGSFTCECPPGYTGQRCQDFRGGCLDNPCMNGGECHPIGLSVDQYRCSCPVGRFTGVNCETEIDHCSTNPCRYGGWCTSDHTGYTCTCLQGFTGTDCGQPLLTCNSNPMVCGANGECTARTVDGFTSRFCSCNPGYAGEFCSLIVDGCDSEPCFHRSTCIPSSGVNPNVSFSCSCSNDWRGFYCTECSLGCEGQGQPDAQCTRCVCDVPNTDNMCNPTTSTQGSSTDDNDDDNTGVIAGAVVGGFVVVGLAVVMVTIAIYFIAKSSKTKRMTRDSSWMDSPFATTPFGKESSMPRFSGPLVGTKSAFGRKQGSLYGDSTLNELSGNDDTIDS